MKTFLSIILICLSSVAFSQQKSTIETDFREYQLESPKKLYRNCIYVSIANQKLYYFNNNILVRTYPISSSFYGIGNEEGSNKTPLGLHKIKRKFGKKTPIGGILIDRKFTGDTAEIITDTIDIEKDYITSRILWLKGLEKGINKGKNIDSYKRYIYIHGTPEEGLIGQPSSHGCIRMKNDDIIELYKNIKRRTRVLILEK